MKKLKLIILSLGFLVFLASCEKDVQDTSKITYFPIIELQGDAIMNLTVGDAYSEPGAKAFEGTKEIELKTTGSVNTSEPGVYIITYEAVNVDGFSSLQHRWIGVSTQEAKNDDLTGKYQRTAGKMGISEWTKLMPGVYKCTDVGGAQLPDQYVIVFNTEKNIIQVPVQPLGGSGSDVSCLAGDGGEKITFNPGPAGTAAYKWVVINSGYGTALRTFLKVE